MSFLNRLFKRNDQRRGGGSDIANPDDVAATILCTCKNEDVSLFVGAGISLQPPASLPSANDLKWLILETLAGQEARDQDRPLLQEYLNTHALELFLQDLKESIGTGVIDILDIFRQGKPNLYHKLIARLARNGLIQRVVTTNFDCLIERALAEDNVDYAVLSTEHDFAECVIKPEQFASFNVVKLHGTIAFMAGKEEIPGQREVKAISPLNFELRKLQKIWEAHQVLSKDFGLERTISAKETLIASLDRLGITLSEVTTELLVKYLETSTVIVIGWNGFDLDISPLFLEHAKKMIWIVHAAEHGSDVRRTQTENKLDAVRRELRSRGIDEIRAEMVLLANTPDYSLNVLPTPDKERAEILGRSSSSMEARVLTPHLIRNLWSQLTSGDVSVRDTNEADGTAGLRKLRMAVQNWSRSTELHLPLRWGLAKFFLHHGEYEATRNLLGELLEEAAAERLDDVTAMLRMDFAELNAIYGNRAEAESAFHEAIRLYERIIPLREPSRIVESFHLHQLLERAYFGLGELACEFYDFEAAARAFSGMPTADTIAKALVHYCREEFQEAKRLLAGEIRFVRIGRGRFHHYLYYFLKLVDARINLMWEHLDMAVVSFGEVLTATTKLGFPRLQVQALNGLALTYGTYVKGGRYQGLKRLDSLGRIDPYYDHLKAARFAVQSIAIANQAEYRYGRAHAGFYMGIIYAAVGLYTEAVPALRYSERLFAKLGHSAGLGFCHEAKLRYDLEW